MKWKATKMLWKRTPEETKAIIEEALDSEMVIPRWEKVEEELVWEALTLRQEKFCKLYALDTRFMGNWVSAYMEVYDIDTEKKWWYASACACASRLLSNAKVYCRINDLLEEQGLNDQFVDKQLLYVISQQSDITNKVSAIKEYNKLKQRITDKMQVDSTIQIESIDIL
jgi:hypothetical protein